jgi:hypothetical protein
MTGLVLVVDLGLVLDPGLGFLKVFEPSDLSGAGDSFPFRAGGTLGHGS